MSLGGEDVVVDVDGELALLRKEQVEVFEHLGQEEGVHPTHKETELLNRKFSGKMVHHVTIAPPVLVHPRADVLHSSESARHPGVGVELLHDGLSHSEVVRVASGLHRFPRTS